MLAGEHSAERGRKREGGRQGREGGRGGRGWEGRGGGREREEGVGREGEGRGGKGRERGKGREGKDREGGIDGGRKGENDTLWYNCKQSSTWWQKIASLVFHLHSMP